MFGDQIQSAKVCVCERGPVISVLIFNAFSSIESEGVSAYTKFRQNLLYSLIQSMEIRIEDPSDIFNMLFIETAIDFFFLFFFHY